MDLSKLQSFAALAEHGSIARTAELLYLTPPAIHKQLKSLEATYGVQLYERVGNQLQLTPVGRLILPQVKRLLAQYEAIGASVAEWKGLRRGVVRLGAGPTFAAHLLPPLLRAFRRRYPELDIVVATASARQLAHALDAAELDVAFLTSPELLDASPEFAVVAEWSFELGLAANPCRGLDSPTSLAALGAVPFVTYAEGSAFDVVTGAFFISHGFRPHVTMRLDNAETIKAMVCSDLGVAMLPAWMLGGELAERSLVLTRLEEGAVEVAIAMAVRGQDPPSEPVTAFAEFGLRWSGWDAHLRRARPRQPPAAAARARSRAK